MLNIKSTVFGWKYELLITRAIPQHWAWHDVCLLEIQFHFIQCYYIWMARFRSHFLSGYYCLHWPNRRHWSILWYFHPDLDELVYMEGYCKWMPFGCPTNNLHNPRLPDKLKKITTTFTWDTYCIIRRRWHKQTPIPLAGYVTIEYSASIVTVLSTVMQNLYLNYIIVKKFLYLHRYIVMQ